MKFTFTWVLPIFLTISAKSFGVSLTWEDCLRFTAESNTALETAKKEWMATRENEGVAFAGYLPRLSASTSITKNGSTGAGGGAVVSNGVLVGGGTGSQVLTNYFASLNFSQNIFNGFEDKARLTQAEWRTRTSFWAYETAKSNVSFSLKEAFAGLVYAQETLDLYQEILDRRESNFKLVSVRFENGRENKGSVLLAEAYLEQARLDVIRSKDSLDVARRRLASLMNKDHLGEISVTGEIPLLPVETNDSEVEKLALKTPSYHQAQALEKIADEEITVSRSAFLPSLDLTGNATRQGPSYFPERERWSVALTLSIPLFDGLRDYGTIKASTLSRFAAEARRRSTLLDLLPRLKDARNLARQSELKYSIDRKFKEAASTRADIARAKYNNGLISFEDWDIIENELIQRQTSFLQSKRDRVVRYATWENVLGKGAIE